MTPNKEHRKVFGDNPPMTGWRKAKLLNDHLVSAKIKCESSSDNKSTLFKTRIKLKRLILEKGF